MRIFITVRYYNTLYFILVQCAHPATSITLSLIRATRGLTDTELETRLCLEL